jgi:hypothetical protein
MTIEEYNAGIKSINERAELTKKQLIREYALSNNPYKIGDIIRDHASIIKIDKIQVYLSYNEPCCVYSGPELKKDGTSKLPKKNGETIRTSIYQPNIQILK